MNYAACLDQVSLKEGRLVDRVPSINRIALFPLEISLYGSCEYCRFQLKKTWMTKSYTSKIEKLSEKEIASLVADLKSNANRLRVILTKMESSRKIYDSIFMAASRRTLGRVGRIFDEKIDDLEISLSKKIQESLDQLVASVNSSTFDITRVPTVG